MQPRFGETDFTFYKTNETNCVLTVQNAEEEAFSRYLATFLEEGYSEKEAYSEAHLRFSALKKDGEGIFLSYFPTLQELVVVKEENCIYFDFEDPCLPLCTVPQITQLHLTDFGLSYAVRLSDGRFIVFDGGFDTPEDRKVLFDCLVAQSEGKTPRIACWILTHPHEDHHRCFNGFWKEYEGKVKMDAVLWHFPSADDVEHYPKFARSSRGRTITEEILLNHELIQKIGCKDYTAHTGQTYRFGDAKLRILGCMENTIHLSNNINTTSLVIRMELGGQVILWTGDAYCSYLRLAQRYENDLKADILQIFHHGFSSGKAAPVIEAYDEIRAPVCFLPTTEFSGFSSFSIHQEATRHLFDMEETLEVITGDTSRTIILPYTPAQECKAILKDRMVRGLALCGKDKWEFSPEEECTYTLKNITHSIPDVMIKSTLCSGETQEEALTIPKVSQITFTPAENTASVLIQSSVPIILEKQGELI